MSTIYQHGLIDHREDTDTHIDRLHHVADEIARQMSGKYSTVSPITQLLANVIGLGGVLF